MDINTTSEYKTVVMRHSSGILIDCWILKDNNLPKVKNGVFDFEDSNRNRVLVSGEICAFRVNKGDLKHYEEYHKPWEKTT